MDYRNAVIYSHSKSGKVLPVEVTPEYRPLQSTHVLPTVPMLFIIKAQRVLFCLAVRYTSDCHSESPSSIYCIVTLSSSVAVAPATFLIAVQVAERQHLHPSPTPDYRHFRLIHAPYYSPVMKQIITILQNKPTCVPAACAINYTLASDPHYYLSGDLV
jgi:hypothetical protein